MSEYTDPISLLEAHDEHSERLLATLISFILAQGKTEVAIPWSLQHPTTKHPGPLRVQREFDLTNKRTIYRILKAI